MAKKHYLTVLFEYEEGAQLPKELIAALGEGSYRDTQVVAVSLEDEFQRVEQLEQGEDL